MVVTRSCSAAAMCITGGHKHAVGRPTVLLFPFLPPASSQHPLPHFSENGLLLVPLCSVPHRRAHAGSES